MLCSGIRAASSTEGRPKAATLLRSELALQGELAPVNEAALMKEAPLLNAEMDRPLPPPKLISDDASGLPGPSHA